MLPLFATDEAQAPRPNQRARAQVAQHSTNALVILRNGQLIADRIASDGTVKAFAISPDNRYLASGADDNLIKVFDLANGELVATLRGHQAELLSVCFSPDGRTLASSARDRTLRLWHPPTWRDLGSLYQGELVTRLQFTPDGAELEAATPGGTIHLKTGSTN